MEIEGAFGFEFMRAAYARAASEANIPAG